jgi:hypothetical protein
MVPHKTKRVRIAEQISERRAEKLLSDLVRFSNWTRGPIPPTSAVRTIISQHGMTPKQAVNFTRRFFEPVPGFENQMGPTFTAIGDGVRVVRQAADGSMVDVSGPIESGSDFTLANYWAKFEFATGQLVRAAQSQQFSDVLAAVTAGISSIDNFVIELATSWNFSHPDGTRFDPGEHSSLSDRLDTWIPIITGDRYDKGGRSWQAHLRLRKFRNDWDQHDKSTYRVTTPALLVDLGNDFGPGIAEVLFDLHVLAGRRVPAIIVKYKYFPGYYVS